MAVRRHRDRAGGDPRPALLLPHLGGRGDRHRLRLEPGPAVAVAHRRERRCGGRLGERLGGGAVPVVTDPAVPAPRRELQPVLPGGPQSPGQRDRLLRPSALGGAQRLRRGLGGTGVRRHPPRRPGPRTRRAPGHGGAARRRCRMRGPDVQLHRHLLGLRRHRDRPLRGPEHVGVRAVRALRPVAAGAPRSQAQPGPSAPRPGRCSARGPCRGAPWRPGR